jgi:hypothetical protein
MSVGQDLLDTPFADMVLQLGTAIAQAQTALDTNSIQTLLELSTNKVKVSMVMHEKADGSFLADDPVEMSLLQWGINPTFYQFNETIIEVKMAISMKKEKDLDVTVGAKVGFKVWSASVDAKYSQKYSYSVDGSSLLRTTLVPVPPPARLIPQIIPYVAP